MQELQKVGNSSEIEAPPVSRTSSDPAQNPNRPLARDHPLRNEFYRRRNDRELDEDRQRYDMDFGVKRSRGGVSNGVSSSSDAGSGGGASYPSLRRKRTTPKRDYFLFDYALRHFRLSQFRFVLINL